MIAIAVLLSDPSTAEAMAMGAVAVVLLWLVVKVLTKEPD